MHVTSTLSTTVTVFSTVSYMRISDTSILFQENDDTITIEFKTPQNFNNFLNMLLVGLQKKLTPDGYTAKTAYVYDSDVAVYAQDTIHALQQRLVDAE